MEKRNTNRTEWANIGLVCLVLSILIVTLSLNVSIAGEPGMAGGCVCISFDKWDMQRADKIVIEFRGETYTVTDPEFVRSFCQRTTAGTYSDYCCAHHQEGSIEIYRQGRLIRRMRYVENHDAIVYDADPTHWVLFGTEGHAFLTGDICGQFRQLVGLYS